MEPQDVAPPGAVSAKSKQPPPEKPEAISLRTKIIVSFWAVILFLGLPTWWQTTSIYRAELPLQEMLDWSDGSNAPAAIPLHIWISAPGIPCVDAQKIVRDTQQALDDLNEHPMLHQRLYLVDHPPKSQTREGQGEATGDGHCGQDISSPELGEPALQVSLSPSADAFRLQLDDLASTGTFYFPPAGASHAGKELAASLNRVFRDEQIAAALQAISLPGVSNKVLAFLRSQPGDVVRAVESQIKRAYKASPEFHLTFSLFTASGAPSSWEIQEALRDHVQPLIKVLGQTAGFFTTTQIQLYSEFSPAISPVRFIVDGEPSEGTFLFQKDLAAFVNAAEWPLSPSIGDGPTINFVLYVPVAGQIPLSIEGADGGSWLVPQWGGIQILNPPLSPHPVTGVPTIPAHVNKALLDAPFEAFASQLLSLLGVLQTEVDGKMLPLQLRLDAYKRLAALNLYIKAASNLGSLSRLAQRLSNIPIPRHVSQLVDNTVGNLTASTRALAGSHWNAALARAKNAYEDSEKAFFDKSMVGQVYFPDEHKVAVYLPLLGPIGVPLLVGLIREAKNLLSKRRGGPT